MANRFLIQFILPWVSILGHYFLLVLHVTPFSSLHVRNRLFSLFEVYIDLKVWDYNSVVSSMQLRFDLTSPLQLLMSHSTATASSAPFQTSDEASVASLWGEREIQSQRRPSRPCSGVNTPGVSANVPWTSQPPEYQRPRMGRLLLGLVPGAGAGGRGAESALRGSRSEDLCRPVTCNCGPAPPLGAAGADREHTSMGFRGESTLK